DRRVMRQKAGERGRGPDRRPGQVEEGASDGDEESEAARTNYSDLDLTPSLGIQAGESMMAEIIERYPNGNYKVRATKRVPFKGSTRMVTLVAIARGQ